MDKKVLSLEEAALSFLATLLSEERAFKQQEVNRFIVWCGKDRPICQLGPLDVSNYAEQVVASTGDVVKKLEPVKEFLTYAKKNKHISVSLISHLRIRQPSQKSSKISPKSKKGTSITLEGYEKLKIQLAGLEKDRVEVAKEMNLAAADKDFRENAPLQAARERRDHIEAQIRKVQSDINSADIVDGERPAEDLRIRLRCKVTLRDVPTGKELTYTLVTKNESNPSANRISIESPIGKALLNQQQGNTVRVIAPIGELCYYIERIE